MRILQVIHGYPPYYMAGSEVYTYNLTQELARLGHEVWVFTRIEDPFMEPYEVFDERIGDVKVRRINKPYRDYSLRDKYIDESIDRAFEEYLDIVEPDVVHFQHLSHLSTNIVRIARNRGLPIIYTLHDYWLICPRGQLITRDHTLCTGPSPLKCTRCLSYMYPSYRDVVEYRRHMEKIMSMIDVYLSPSKFLLEIMARNGIPREKMVYSPYGFDKSRIKYSEKTWGPDSRVRFGFVGRIIPVKGVHILLDAFNMVKEQYDTELLIYGDPGRSLPYLKRRAGDKVWFMGGFDNRLIDSVLESIDVLVVPSIWYENSPLVIQEAFLKGRPVIASDLGGSAELVRDGVNGLLFHVGDPSDLASKMKRVLENPSVLNGLRPDPGLVRDIRDDASSLVEIYKGYAG